MNEIKLTINGKECIGEKGDTILQVANKNGVFIPTLCNDERVRHYGACGVCLVEGEGLPKLMRACSQAAADGWVLSTETDRVKRARKIALELLMSDHDADCKGPCSLTCPAGTDCQGYIKAASQGDFHEAVRIVKEKFPLPISIGTVCPHPCEDKCRRQYVEKPLSIAYIKKYSGLRDLEDGPYVPDVSPDTGKSVAVVGGGPAGLTAAFQLKRMGHGVTVFDAMPHMGGMLYYGIPAYRLPKRYVEAEVKEIEKLGVIMKNNVRIGKDITLEDLKKSFDAVIIAIGAWKSQGVGCEGDGSKGVLGGIDFLRHNIEGNPDDIGKNVVVVGGGNTAMDACRSAVRCGAENVYVVYRRSRDEMPADAEEIDEAIEEGVRFKFLTNPAEIISEGGKVKQVKLQVMQLGEPDESGRRRPVPVEGKFEILDADTVISAIGQKVNPEGFDLELNKKGIISADEHTFLTSEGGVFAVGDATNKGASIAIEAVGEAEKCSRVVDSYLKGKIIGYKAPFVSERKDLEKIKEDLKARDHAERVKIKRRPAAERKKDFESIYIECSEGEVISEAKRCLECGCFDYGECDLIKCANLCDIAPERLEGEYHPGFTEDVLEVIERNQRKCVSCNLCVRACEEVASKGLLGLVGRGFTTIIRPEFKEKSVSAYCAECKLCADICPTGALKIIK